MKLKPIKYPTLSAVKKYGVNRLIIQSPAGWIETGIADLSSGTKCIVVAHKKENDWQMHRTYFPMTDAGYTDAQNNFEKLTLDYFKQLVGAWIEE